jgi:hypothetical protein
MRWRNDWKFNFQPLHPPVCSFGLSFSLSVSRQPFRSAVGAAFLSPRFLANASAPKKPNSNGRIPPDFENNYCAETKME